MLTTVARRPRAAGLALGLAALLAAPAPARADQIDRVMVHDSAAIVSAVRDLGVKTVAVLKFQVKVGDARPTFRAGTEGTEMIHRMENILILGVNTDKPEYTVLTGAGDAASALARESKTAVDWTTPEGRKRLAGLSLPVAWNDKQKLAADGYVTGVVRTTKDLQEVYIDLVGFTKSDPAALKKLGTLGVKVNGKAQGIRMDRSMLASMGQTFSTSRSLKAKPKATSRDLLAADETAAADAAGRESKAIDANGATPPAGPVKLEILIDGQLAPQEPDSGSRGEYKVASKLSGSATAGQKVTFRLQNTGTEPVAALLCVNGKNTIAIDKEDLAGSEKVRAKFRMYVLDPGKKYDIKGFLKDEAGTYAPFEVLPEDRASVEYDKLDPENRGKIQLIVYGKSPIKISGGTEPSSSGDEAETQMDDAFASSGLATSDRSLGKTGNLESAKKAIQTKTQLRSLNGTLKAAPRKNVAKAKARTLIIERSETTAGGAVEVVPFEYDEQPLDSLVLSYYSKENPPAETP